MFKHEYDKIIREYFDLSDNATRKTIVALEDTQQNQLLTALSSALYDMIIKKVDKIDFGTIPRSRGDITKVDGFDNTVECLNVIRKLVIEYKQNPEVVDTVLAAIQNIKDRKGIFMKAFALNVEFPMVIYNLTVLAIEQSVSFLIAVCIQYIKNDETKTIEAALDKTAYNNTKDNLLYEQLVKFNISCATKDIDKAMEDIIKNGGKVSEGMELAGDGVNSIVINVGAGTGNSVNKAKCPGFQELPEKDSSEVINEEEPEQQIDYPKPLDSVIPAEEPVREDLADIYDKAISISNNLEMPAKIAIGAAVVATGAFLIGRSLKFVITIAIPYMRRLTYYFINGFVKLSDSLSVQAQFLEANAYKLQTSTISNLDDVKREKVVKRQLKIAENMKAMANKLAIDNKKSEKKAKEMVQDDSKKLKINDIEDQLPADITSALF